MKKLLKIACLGLALLCTCNVMVADPRASLVMSIVKLPVGVGEEPIIPDESENRKPGKPFTCTFDSETGIEFIGQETPEFSLYEIYVTETECIYASGDEFDFIDKLFTLSGSYQICLTTTDGCVYAGYVNL